MRIEGKVMAKTPRIVADTEALSEEWWQEEMEQCGDHMQRLARCSIAWCFIL